MESRLPVSIILPIKSAKTKDFSEFFEKCVNSIKNQSVQIDELIIIHCNEEELTKFISEYNFDSMFSVSTFAWDKPANFADQINFGISKSKNEWVSIIEFDDEYSSIWFKNFEKYSEAYPKVQMFLPVVVETDDKSQFAGFTNEATFAANFAQEISYLTSDILQNYQNFQLVGSVFRKSIISEFGGLKPSMSLTFIYEFLLRMTYNSVSIMTIPKLGYRHTNMREGSIFWNYKFGPNKLSDDEVKFWLQCAKKEYFFPEDREIKYSINE